MARIRTIKPEFFTSDTVSALPLRARLTWIGLWTHCDDHGRCRDNVKLIKAAVWPLDDVSIRHVEEDLAVLTEHGCIIRYVVDDRPYLAVPTWDEHQSASHRRGPARFPGPDDGTIESPGRRDNGPDTDGDNVTGVSPNGVVEGANTETIDAPGQTTDASRTTSHASRTTSRAGTGNREQGTGTADTTRFAAFWALYPRKVNKSDALKAWKKLTPDDQQTAIETIPQHTVAWTRAKTEMRFIPHANRWLNARRFEDDLAPSRPKSAVHVDQTNGAVMSDYALRNS